MGWKIFSNCGQTLLLKNNASIHQAITQSWSVSILHLHLIFVAHPSCILMSASDNSFFLNQSVVMFVDDHSP